MCYESIAGIATKLARFENKVSAISIAQQWRVMLEDMSDIANAEQRKAIARLLIAVNGALQVLVK